MDVMTAVSSQPCLDLSSDLEPVGGGRDDSLESATYLGSVTVTEGEQGVVGAGGVETVTNVSAPYLQFVENTAELCSVGSVGSNNVYTTGAGTVYVSPSLYPPSSSPPTSTFFDTGTSSLATYPGLSSGPATNQSQLVTYAGSTFLIQPSPDGSSTPLITAVTTRPETESPSFVSTPGGEPEPGGPHSLSYATRVSPATIQWLIANYETAEGVSLPRSTLYNHYLKHCDDSKQDPVNAASFGKLIRSVFLGLKTRRIGTRGNSKYHYYGIRVKPTSQLNGFDDSSPPPKPAVAKKRLAKTGDPAQPDQSLQVSSSLGSTTLGQYLGTAQTEVTVPDITIEPGQLPEGLDQDTVSIFSEMYKQHLSQLLEAVVNLNFASIQHIWMDFWSLNESKLNQTEESKLPMSKAKQKLLLTIPEMQAFIQEGDFTFYQSLVQILIPEVLRPIPASLTQAIRNFAKSLESWLTQAMVDCPDQIRNIKLSTVRSFSQTLRRYTSLNHLAQAAKAVMQNQQQISQMLTDLNKVDFTNVQEQASWVCGCDLATVTRLEESFKATLQQQASLESWATWLEGVVDSILNTNLSKENYIQAARQFLLRWSFYSSMIIRDLTLRSAASFGSFHLIRLLYDEFMFYIIEHRVAKHLDMTPVAVMGSRKLPPVTTFDNNNLALGTPGALHTNTSQKGLNNTSDPSMFTGDSAIILHSQVIPPSSHSQEESEEIRGTNVTSITSPDIVVKELLSQDNKEPTESESSPKRVKTG